MQVKKLLPIMALLFSALCLYQAVIAQDAGQGTKVYFTNGGDKMVISSGGEMDITSGGAMKVAGTPVPMPEVKANFVANVPVLLVGTPTPGVHTFMGGVNIVPTYAAGAAALLPTDGTSSGHVTVINTGANEINVCPGAGDTILSGGTAGSANICVGIATLGTVTFRAVSASSWYAHAFAAAPTPGN